MKRLSVEVRAGYRREAEEAAGKVVGCVFEVISQITGVRGTPEPFNFSNAAMFQRFAEDNADYAIECAAKAVQP